MAWNNDWRGSFTVYLFVLYECDAFGYVTYPKIKYIHVTGRGHLMREPNRRNSIT